jgi:hypothetical protein
LYHYQARTFHEILTRRRSEGQCDLVLRYEDMAGDMPGVVRQIAELAGVAGIDPLDRSLLAPIRAKTYRDYHEDPEAPELLRQWSEVEQLCREQASALGYQLAAP